MRGFAYTRCESLDSALAALPAHNAHADLCTRTAERWVAGGTNLLDLMKEDVQRPVLLMDVGRLPLTGIEPTADGGLSLGATARNADTAHHPLVRSRYPLLSAAILAGASPQIRNMATNGGNLLQRTRCYYFYDVGVPCNKREPGSGCPAREGLARQLAILGTSEHCIATHPSDMCVALAALDATVHVHSARGARAIAFADFHRLPGDRPDVDTTLAANELITHITLPPEGCVAHKPWRDAAAEALLEGQPPTDAHFARCAERLLTPARAWGAPHGPGHNGFKIPLAREAIVRALGMARDGVLTNTGELATDRLEDRA